MKKRLTNAEKKTNARIKKEMQKKGILPPDKPRLNRKKFVEEAIKEWKARNSVCWVWEVYITQAAFIMSGVIDKNLRVTQEAVRAAKVLKIVIRLEEFSNKLKAENRSTYTVGEQYEFIKDILEA